MEIDELNVQFKELEEKQTNIEDPQKEDVCRK